MGWGRAYLAVQAAAGAAWWIAVFMSPTIREATLGSLDPVTVAVFGIPLFVVASEVAAFGMKPAAMVSAGWTAIVAMALVAFATFTFRQAPSRSNPTVHVLTTLARIVVFCGNRPGRGGRPHPVVLAGRRLRGRRVTAVELRHPATRRSRPRGTFRRRVPRISGQRAVLGAPSYEAP